MNKSGEYAEDKGKQIRIWKGSADDWTSPKRVMSAAHGKGRHTASQKGVSGVTVVRWKLLC